MKRWVWVALVLLVACTDEGATSNASKAPAPTTGASASAGTLAKDAARKVIDADAQRAGGQCTWTDPRRHGNSGFAYAPFQEEQQRCADAMVRAGLVELGECTDKGCTGGCCARIVKATGDAKASLAEPMGIRFPCGKFVKVTVNAISTNGPVATVRYARTFKANQKLLADLESCQLTRPYPGRKAFQVDLRRFDDGWKIEPQSRKPVD